MTLCCALLGSAQPEQAQARLTADLHDSRDLARLDHLVWSQPLVDDLVQVAHFKEPHIDRMQVVQHLIMDHLLADYARQHFPQDVLDPGLRVDFPHHIMIDNEVMSTLRVVYRAPLAAAVQALPQHRILSCVLRTYPLDNARQAQIFVVPNHLMLGYDLPAASQDLAKKVVLMDYQFPGAPVQHITLFDVYERENVQGRMSLFHHDLTYLKRQMLELLSIRFVMDWTQRHSGLNADDLRVMRQALEDKSAADALRGIMGTVADLDEGSAYLAGLAKNIPDAAIHTYYTQHKEQFRRIDRVRAQHIEVNDKKLADQLSTQLKQGADFAALAKKYSVAADAAQGGDLGWIIHDESGHASWLAQVAMTQKPGAEIRPILAPGTPAHPLWELMRVSQIDTGYQREDGPSVHFEVAQILARELGQRNFQAIEQQLLNTADIHVAPALKALKLP